MDLNLLQDALATIKAAMDDAISRAVYSGDSYVNGQRAKEALIRSQTLIGHLHEVVKISLDDVLQQQSRQYRIYPPIGYSSPELSLAGHIKKKKQDIVVLSDNKRPEIISAGPRAGQSDPVGREVTERSIVVGIRSQLSSVDNNFDTLMERAFAETLNLRLRVPRIVMGEVYLLPVFEYDKAAMINNHVDWLPRPTNIAKFINVFLAISGRSVTSGSSFTDIEQIYKYERSALILADFRQMPPRVFLKLDDLVSAGLLPFGFQGNFGLLSPERFAEDIVAARLSLL